MSSAEREKGSVRQDFNGSDTYINKDEDGTPREVFHLENRFVPKARTPLLAAREYLEQRGDLISIKPAELKNLSLAPEHDLIDALTEYRYLQEKTQFDVTTIAFQQTYFGLPVWEAGLSINIKLDPFTVISAQSTSHKDLEVKRPTDRAINRAKRLTNAKLAKALGLTESHDIGSLKIQSQRLIIYRYESKERVAQPEKPSGELGSFIGQEPPTLPLPRIGRGIEDGTHYVAAEVHFILGLRRYPDLRWVAILEATTLSVLYLRAFVADVNGLVFRNEPMTDNGGPLPNASNASLNAVRTSEKLQGLNAPVAGIQSLSGNLVKLEDTEPPTVAPPTEPSGTDFNFDARTNDFAAVNAYYHCVRFFRLLEDLGFSLSTYMSGTSFPSSVDHRGSISTANGIEVNAHCLGTGLGGILRTTFALADLSDTAHPIGIACDYRVVLHELGGHGILYNHVNKPNFGFAHSAGDSFAAIINDPETHAPDRFVTFPWVDIGRRHDRSVLSGWGWGGSHDVGGYSSEQILSTTHFRIYRSIGGDSAWAAMRMFASRFASYLILRAIGSLTPATNPSNVSGYATALITADQGDWTSEGQAGGAYCKVIRWAFEKQGLYQPLGAPTPVTAEGAPPAVDVYIDDGRHGEYQYQANHWSCQVIWNRRNNDGLTTHEEPLIGATNYAYVKVKNRGTQTATGVIVKGFHCNPGTGLIWPNDWVPMTTAQLSVPNVPPNNSAETKVGPFEWIPSQVGHECILMIVSAIGDPSNINNFTAGESIPEWRLVPHDNNIGQRNVYPIPGGGGSSGLLASSAALRFSMRNPHPFRARMAINTIIPRVLADRGWGLEFTNAGGRAFTLDAGEMREIVMQFKPGEEFTSEDVEAERDPYIHVETYAGGIPIGGMSYYLDSKLKFPAPQKPPRPEKKCEQIAQRLLECLGIPNEKVKEVRIKRVIVDINVEDDP